MALKTRIGNMIELLSMDTVTARAKFFGRVEGNVFWFNPIPLHF
jgi:hypothetical protein